MLAAIALLAVAEMTSATGVVASQRARSPVPLRGVPLRGDTGLRLVVADRPPFVLDVDTGRVTPVRGVPPVKRGVLWVVGVGGRAAVVVAETVWRRAQLYAVRGGGARVSRLGTGADVTPAADGRSVWVKSVARPSHCTLRQFGLDGRVIRAPRQFPCASTIYPGGSLGLVVNRTRVLEPLSGRTLLTTPWGVLAAAGEKLLLTGPGSLFTLLDTATRAQKRRPWPSILIWLDEPAVDPQGRFVALSFASPAWEGGSRQALDVWLLDTQTGKLTQVPGMPAFVALKGSSMAWTPDGRLVLLAHSDRRDMVAVWRPGQPRLAVKTVRLPDRADSGSDTFAILG